jgi:hypothetical protein
VDEIELASRVFPMQTLVTFHGRSAIGASLNDRNAIQHTPTVFCMGCQSLDNEPLIRICLLDLMPDHVCLLSPTTNTHPSKRFYLKIREDATEAHREPSTAIEFAP